MLRVINFLHCCHTDINLAHAAKLMKTLIRMEFSQNGPLLSLTVYTMRLKKKGISLNRFKQYDKIHKITVMYFCDVIL